MPEPAQDNGKLIVGRYAFARFELVAIGQPAHAGATLKEGRSAIREMAEQIIKIESMSDPERNLTYSVGVINGGTFANVVPIECRAKVLAVAATQEDLDEICERMMSLKAINKGVEFEVVQGPIRPLFEPNDDVMSLYRLAEEIAQEIGFSPGR